MTIALVGAAPVTIYTAPAGNRIAGSPNPNNPYDAILPNGRIVAPTGKSAVVGMNALNVALSPNGRYAIVTNDDESQAAASSRYAALAHGGYSLAVVDTATMQLTDSWAPAGAQLFLGVTALKDPANPANTLVIASGGGGDAVYFLDLDPSGKLHEESRSVQIPGPSDPRYANRNHAFAGWIALSPNHRTAYVVNMIGNTVSAIDIASRTLLHSADVGFFPYAGAVEGQHLYVTDPGLMQYGNLPQPAPAPQFSNVAFAPQQASALTAVALSPGGDVMNEGTVSTPMDRAPDGVNDVGGAHPGAIEISKNGRYAYVCMANVDRVSIVDLFGIPRVVGGLQLRLFDKSPYGTQPDAIVRSPDGKRMYVALAGMNAIAVLDSHDPARLHRLGLIPTGWYPTGIAVSPTGRYLYVTNAKGFGEGSWATLQRIDLHRLPLQKTTLSALRYTRVPRRVGVNPIVPPIRSLQRSSAIRHVVFVLEAAHTFDDVLGDLTDAQGQPYGGGDPSLVSDGASITPNLHALAREFGLATNLYADAEDSAAGHEFATSGIATSYTEKTEHVKGGLSPLMDGSQDPEDYPRSGFIFNAAQRAAIAYRDYGGMMRLSGYDDAPPAAGKTAAAAGLGGLYTLDVPALAALGNHVDLAYPGWNPHISDAFRAKEFVRDYSQLEQQNAVPDFTYVWLPGDYGASDSDGALGAIVDFLSHQPSWSSTAIFITPDSAQGARDHVNEHRTYAIVVSPYAKRHYLGAAHLSTVSVLKTEEELLGLPPLSLGDLLATDMSDFFEATPDPAPFTAIPVPAARTAQSGTDSGVERSSSPALPASTKG